jgi:hypothetical protein
MENDNTKIIELTLVQWIAALKSKDRSHKSVKPNFEELFQAWKQSGCTFDELYEVYLPKAIKAHQPLPSVARSAYKSIKAKAGYLLDKSEKEFLEEWTASIEAAGTEVFFDYFPATNLDKDDEPKVFGNMSAKEYRAQRKYADQFPTLDTTELVKQWKEEKYNINIDDMLSNVLGNDKDETNS